MPNILLTGGNGFVAGSIIVQAPPSTTLHVWSRQELDLGRPNVRSHVYAEVSRDAFVRHFEQQRPDVVMHTAAIAAIDYCESNHEEAWQTNVTFPRILAELCAEFGVRMIHCSTDNVFDGEQTLYTEEDLPRAVNFYGHTKIEAEKAVRAALEDHVIARISIVYGLAMIGAGNSFLEQMLPKLRSGQTVGVPNNEIRSPIDVATLGQALLELCGHTFRGTLHLSNNDRVNRVDLVQRIARHLGLPPELVEANDPTNIPGRAPRPLDVSLSNKKASGLLSTQFCGIEEGLDRVMALAPKQP